MLVHAYAAAAPHAPLRPHTYEAPPLGPFDVELAITHCGICHSDVHLVDNDWQISQYPLVPGHEIIGTVRTLGPAVTHLRPGQRVGVGWQAGSCLHCEWCTRGDEQACPESRATCVGRPGGFADSIRLDSRFAFPVPDNLPSETAAPLFCAGVTVYTPLRQWATPSMRVGVVAIGGLGHLAVQFANAMGCHVTAFSTTASKREEAAALGAHQFFVSTDAGQMERAANSIDLLLTTPVGEQDWAAWMRTLRPRGTLCLLGASPNPLNVPPMALIPGGRSIRGSAIGSRWIIRDMLDFAARHGIRTQIERRPMAEADAALQHVRQGRARYRVVLVN